jgi:capsular polysaccharide biosynthesis protein
MMTLDELVAVVWRRRVPFAVTLALVVASVAAVTFSLPSVYSSTTYLFATTADEGQSDFEATQANQALARTYVELLRTQGTRDAVLRELPFRTSAAALEKAVRVSAVSQSQLVRITAEGSSPQRARTLAETYARVFLPRGRALADTGAGAGAGMTTLRVAEPARLSSSPVRPRPRLYLTVGAMVGLLLAGTVAVVWDRLGGRRREHLLARRDGRVLASRETPGATPGPPGVAQGNGQEQSTGPRRPGEEGR